jgi:uncharacterized protein (DUF433 family)
LIAIVAFIFLPCYTCFSLIQIFSFYLDTLSINIFAVQSAKRNKNIKLSLNYKCMQKPFDRITFNPQIMGGRACIRGMRITVSLVLSLIANGLTTVEILSEYPDLEAEDIRASLLYAAFLANEEVRSFVGMSA